VARVDQQYTKKEEQKKDLYRDTAGNQIKEGSSIVDISGAAKKVRHYEKENSIVAHVINNLTCSMRFEGDLNVDLNEITMNLVPFPRTHFLLSSLSPLYNVLNPKFQPRNIDETFKEALDKSNQLIQ
jgi:tubulin epsilon